MEIVRGNDCVVDTNYNPRMRYLINNVCVLAERDPKMAEMTNIVIGRGGGPILLASGSAMDTERQLMVYNYRWGGGGAPTDAYTPSANLQE